MLQLLQQHCKICIVLACSDVRLRRGSPWARAGPPGAPGYGRGCPSTVTSGFELVLVVAGCMLLLLLLQVTCNEPKLAVTWPFSAHARAGTARPRVPLGFRAPACGLPYATPCFSPPEASPARASCCPGAGPILCMLAEASYAASTAGMRCCIAARCPHTIACERSAPDPFATCAPWLTAIPLTTAKEKPRNMTAR